MDQNRALSRIELHAADRFDRIDPQAVAGVGLADVLEQPERDPIAHDVQQRCARMLGAVMAWLAERAKKRADKGGATNHDGWE